MKIGILTYHRAHNYGAVLQCYSLQTFLMRNGHDVEVIDYWPEYHADSYSLFSWGQFRQRSFLGKGKFLIEFIWGLPRVLSRRRGYQRFIADRLCIARASRGIKTRYDVVIYGSDQIWRKQKTRSLYGFDEAYFGNLPTHARMRVAYAASMGVVDISKDDETFLKLNLAKFDLIAVREMNLQAKLRTLGIDSSIVLDPVFLLRKQEWHKLLQKELIPKTKYICFYHLTYSTEALQLVSRISNHFGYAVYEIRNVVKPFLTGPRHRFQAATPEGFLSLLQGAEFVVSTSFHGTAFSVIFEKQFYITGMGNNSDRSRSLLDLLGIGDRYVDKPDEIDLDKKIDYSLVNPQLELLQDQSRAFCSYINGEESVDRAL